MSSWPQFLRGPVVVSSTASCRSIPIRNSPRRLGAAACFAPHERDDGIPQSGSGEGKICIQELSGMAAIAASVEDVGADGLSARLRRLSIGLTADFAMGRGVEDEAGDSVELSVRVVCVSAKTTVSPCWKTWALTTCVPAPRVPAAHAASPPNMQYFGLLSHVRRTPSTKN